MTIKEIAELAGVSSATVSKIRNHKDQNINPETRRRVLEIMKQYKYTPYGTLTGEGTEEFLIGVAVCNGMDTEFIIGITETARTFGYGVLTAYIGGDMESAAQGLRFLMSKSIKGLILDTEMAAFVRQEYAGIIERKHIVICEYDCYPFVNLEHSSKGNAYSGMDATEHGNGHSFRYDLDTMAYYMTECLVNTRHARIGCIVNSGEQERPFCAGFKRCLFDYHIDYADDYILYADQGIDTEQILTKFSAGVCSNYNIALDFYSRCKELHYFVPKDISLLTLQSIAEMRLSYPQIGGIVYPAYAVGERACNALIQEIEGESLQDGEYLVGAQEILRPETSVSIPRESQRNVIVVGNINIDNNFYIARFPQESTSERILDAYISPGGKGLNQAVALAKLGCRPQLIGAIGKDQDGIYLLEHLTREGVSVEGIHRSQSNKTGQAYIYLLPTGSSQITLLGGANDYLDDEKVRRYENQFKGMRYCLIPTEIPMTAVREALSLARRDHVRTVVKPASINSFPEEWYADIDMLIPSIEEAEILAPGMTVEEQTAWFRNKGVHTVVLMLGYGRTYVADEEVCEYINIEQPQPVDTTGEPDAFAATLIAYLMQGCPLVAAVRIALYAARYCNARHGVYAALPTRELLEASMTHTERECLKW